MASLDSPGSAAPARMSAATAPAERQWFIVGRWQEYSGEQQANLLRILAIGAFYIVQLLHYYVFAARDAAQTAFHQQATAIAVAWTMAALAVLLCLRRQIFPALLKYCSTACDVLLLTALASLGGGPASPMIAAYPLVIALAALRFSAPLVGFATLAAMVGYESLVGQADKTWFDADHAVPVATNLVVLVSLALTGLVLGTAVWRVKALAAEYAERLKAARPAA